MGSSPDHASYKDRSGCRTASLKCVTSQGSSVKLHHTTGTKITHGRVCFTRLCMSPVGVVCVGRVRDRRVYIVRVGTIRSHRIRHRHQNRSHRSFPRTSYAMPAERPAARVCRESAVHSTPDPIKDISAEQLTSIAKCQNRVRCRCDTCWDVASVSPGRSVSASLSCRLSETFADVAAKAASTFRIPPDTVVPANTGTDSVVPRMASFTWSTDQSGRWLLTSATAPVTWARPRKCHSCTRSHHRAQCCRCSPQAHPGPRSWPHSSTNSPTHPYWWWPPR